MSANKASIDFRVSRVQYQRLLLALRCYELAREGLAAANKATIFMADKSQAMRDINQARMAVNRCIKAIDER
jgi:hypothetical protein